MDDWRSYDGVAARYESVHAPRFAVVAADLVSMVEPGAGGRVLDVGTGTGVAAHAAHAAGADLVVGIDPSIEMMSMGCRSRRDVRFVGARAIDLPFRNGAFDSVIANCVLSHFTRPETALFDIARVLRPGGLIAVSAWADKPDALQLAWIEVVESFVPREMLAPAWATATPGHERFAKAEALQEALLDAGFRQVRSETRGYRFTYGLDEWIEGQEVWTTGRFVRGMLDPAEWERFRARVRDVFHERFADPLNDFRDVRFAVGTKP